MKKISRDCILFRILFGCNQVIGIIHEEADCMNDSVNMMKKSLNIASFHLNIAHARSSFSPFFFLIITSKATMERLIFFFFFIHRVLVPQVSEAD